MAHIIDEESFKLDTVGKKHIISILCNNCDTWHKYEVECDCK